MAAILMPDAPAQRRAITPKANTFSKMSQDIGCGSLMSTNYESKDPAQCLKPNASFRKANEASQTRLWTRENEFDLFEDKKQTKTELMKVRSRERYFSSSITTLPGP